MDVIKKSGTAVITLGDILRPCLLLFCIIDVHSPQVTQLYNGCQVGLYISCKGSFLI